MIHGYVLFLFFIYLRAVLPCEQTSEMCHTVVSPSFRRKKKKNVDGDFVIITVIRRTAAMMTFTPSPKD